MATSSSKKSKLIKEKIFWENKQLSEYNGKYQALKEKSYQGIIQFFNIPSNAFGLEVACGSGAFSKLISSDMVGVDISFNLLKHSNGIFPVQGNGEYLPFADERFDFVLCAAALHHMQDLYKSIKEINRVLLKNGKLFIFELNSHHPQRKLISRGNIFLKSFLQSTPFSPAERIIPLLELRKTLEKCGFIQEKIKYYTPQFQNSSKLTTFQYWIAKFFSKGILKSFLESYVLITVMKKN